MAFSKRRRSSTTLTEQAINITPLMDVLTVLLFFLIKIFTISSMNITTKDEIVLPTAKLKLTPEEAVTLFISKSSINSEDSKIATIEKNKLSQSSLESDQKTIANLRVFLNEQMKKRNKVFEGAEEGVKLPPGKLLIHADKSVPFRVIKHVLYTAALTGYSDYQFLTTTE